MQQIVISYRRQDSEAITGRIFDRLTTRYGKEAIFRDIDNIPAGSDFRQHIDSVLQHSNLLLVIVGPRWFGHRAGHARIDDETDPVRIEIETALEIGIPVVPVLVGNGRMPLAERLPEKIREFAFRNALKIDSGQDFEFHIARLVKSIDALLVGAEQLGEGIRYPQDAAPSGKWSFLGSRAVAMVAVLIIAIATVSAVIWVRTLRQTVPNLAAAGVKPSPVESEREGALRQGTLKALEGYVRKFPNDPQNSELWEKVFSLRRAEYTEWTIFDVAVALDSPAFLRFSSIEKVNDGRYDVFTKIPINTSSPTYIKDVPKDSIQESLDVYSCQSDESWGSEVTYYSPSGDKIYHYKWAEPDLVSDIVTPTKVAVGSLAASVKRIVCDKWLRTPLASKEKVKNMEFTSLSSTPQGDGDLFYEIVDAPPLSANRHVAIIAKYQNTKKFSDIPVISKTKAFENLTYDITAQLLEIKCNEDKFFSLKTEYFDKNANLIDIAANGIDEASPESWQNILDKSPFGLLRRIVCAGN